MKNNITQSPHMAKRLTNWLSIFLLSFIFNSQSFAQSGIPDSTFDGDGFVKTELKNRKMENILMNSAEQTDGKIVSVGYCFNTTTERYFIVTRQNTNGRMDSTFGINGLVRFTFTTDKWDFGNSVAIQADGKIIAGGYSYGSSGGYDFAFLRL